MRGKWWLKPLDHPDFWDLGFFVGLLLALFKRSGIKLFRKWALNLLKGLEERNYPLNHNLGFLFFFSFVPAYLETGSNRLRKRILTEAERLISIFDERKGFIPMDYPVNDKVAVDTLTSIKFLWWVGKETGRAVFSEIAERHTLTSMRLLLRKDGSTCHIFSIKDGPLAGQGLSSSSCWSRGAAWASLGFLEAYRHTGNDVFLKASQRILRYALKSVGDDGVPPWDFHARDGIKDTSAGAIFLKVLASFNGEFSSWRGALETSLKERYLVLDKKWEGFIKGGCYHYHWRKGIGESLVWGDYFALEAIRDVI